MAIVFKNADAFRMAKEIAGEDKVKLIEEYKKTGQAYIEGTNEEVAPQPGYIRFMDEPQKKVKTKKLAGKKKGKK